MGTEVLIGALFLMTLLAGIGFAMWSKSRTEKLMDRDEPNKPSPLARATPDPRFRPDPDVTDPKHVNH